MMNPRFQSRFQSRFASGPLDNLTGAPQEQPPPKPTTFDMLSRLVIPALAVLLAAVQQQRVFLWALLAVLVVSLALSICPWLASRLRDYIADRRDQKLARRAFREFRRFVRRFDEFAAAPHSRTDTLHAIVLAEMCGGNSSNLEKFRLAPGELFQAFSVQLRGRVEQQEGNLANLHDGVGELNLLIRSYSDYCVQPIFERFPQDLRPLLTDRAKSSLESFRERFLAFLNEYDKYLEGLDESFSKPCIGPHYLPRPKPL